jgi:hypothetical protein
MDDAMIGAIPAATLVELGNSFCGVPPVELSLDTLQHQDEVNYDAQGL